MHFLRLASVTVNVQQARGAIAVRIHEHLVDHRVRDQGAVTGLERIGDGGESGIKVGVGHAAALARPAIVARRSSVDRFGDVSGAA